jgi:hypothetical protein
VNQTIQGLLRHLRGSAVPPEAPADADLFERFARLGDGAAFNVLVGRHDAEGAFQATFFILARPGSRGEGPQAFPYRGRQGGVLWMTSPSKSAGDGRNDFARRAGPQTSS